MARIYVASSWKNQQQPDVVDKLRSCGHQVYDFRNPGGIAVDWNSGDKPGNPDVEILQTSPSRVAPGLQGFAWSQLDPHWETWSPEEYRKHLLANPIASHGFTADFRAMQWADTCVLVLPSGRSAHLEAGWMAGAGKRVVVLLAADCDPELMNLLLHDICVDLQEVIDVLDEGTRSSRKPYLGVG